MRFKSGDKVEVIGNSNSNNTAIGTRLTIRIASGNNAFMVNENAYCYLTVDLKRVILNKEGITKEIFELESHLTTLHEKLSWMNQVGVEEFDELQFKVYRAIQILKVEDNPVEASRLISELIIENK